ncbi:MAG: hypothetical protein HUU50_16055 [Candidatus Brocadiae bacterium]|nr:hypothetical protein [Candidatus Brocadiia bacterium]
MIRNSDILFGRTAATYQFASKESILQAIKEVSALQVLGVEKRIYQILYERGHLKQDEIYAILESLLQSRQIKKIKESYVSCFTEEDEKKFYDSLGLSYIPYYDENEIARLSDCFKEKELPIAKEDLFLGLDIKNSLYKEGITTFLLTILYDKNLLNESFLSYFPDWKKRKLLLVSPRQRNKSRIRKSEGLLFSQIAIAKGKMSTKEQEKSMFAWESLEDTNLPLKYSELLFYMNLMDEHSAVKIAAALYNLSGINQNPRFALIRLNEEEEKYFQTFLEQGEILEEFLEKGKNILVRALQEGLNQIRLSDVLILQKSLSRKKIARKYLESKKNQIEREVHKLQLDKTEEAPIVPLNHVKCIDEEISRTEEFLTRAEKEEKQYNYRAKGFFKKVQKSEEDEGFEKELDDTFSTTQEQKKKELSEEMKRWKKSLKQSDDPNSAHLSSMVERYQKGKKKLQLYIGIAIACIMIFVGYAIASLNPTSLPQIPVKEVIPEPKVAEKPASMDWEKHWGEIAIMRSTYQYQQAIILYQKCERETKDTTLRQNIRKEIQNLQLQSILFEALSNIVRQSQDAVSFTFRGLSKSSIQKVLEQGFILSHEKEEIFIEWKDLKPNEVYRIFKEHKILTLYPWELSLFCYEHRLLEEARESLAFYLRLFPLEKQKAWNLLNSIKGKEKSTDSYQEYEGKLYSNAEIQEQQKKATLITLTKDDPKNPQEIAWDDFHRLQNKILLAKREEYAKDRKEKGYSFAKERWASPSILEYEKQTELAFQEKKLYFKGQWQPKEKLGKWHELILKKQRQKVCGFLLPIKDIYELRTETGISYLNEAQILEKKEIPYPEETYWKERSLVSDQEIKEHLWLEEWASSQGLEKPVDIQWEKILTMAPNYPVARKNLGYIYYQGQWKEESSLAPLQENLVFPFICIELKEASRLGLAKQKSPVLFADESTLMQKASSPKDGSQKEPLEQENLVKSWSKMPPQALSLWKKGRIHLLHKEYTQAMRCFNRVISAKPDFSLAWVDRGKAKLFLANHEGALVDFDKALSMDENLESAFLARGMMYQQQKKYELALNDFIQAYTLDSKNLSTYYALARFYWETGRKKQALALAQQSLEKFSDKKEPAMLSQDINRIQQGAFPSKKLTKASKHCMIEGSCEKIFLDVAAYWTDQLCSQYTKISGEESLPKLKLVLFSDWDSMREYLRLESPYIWEIAKAWPVTEEILVTTDQHAILWKSALFQECLKQIYSSGQPLPFWVWEGLQAYFFYYPEDENGIAWEKVSPYFLRRIQEQLAEFSLSELVSMDGEILLSPDSYWKNRLQAYAWLHFFIHAKEGKHLNLFQKYLLDSKKNKPKNPEFFSAEEKHILMKDFQEYWQKKF